MAEEANGLRERVNHLSDNVGKLWNEKASKESVATLKDDLKTLRTDVKSEVSGLRKTLMAAVGVWLFGTLMFLIAALELAR